jgi:hypothetical protein
VILVFDHHTEHAFDIDDDDDISKIFGGQSAGSSTRIAQVGINCSKWKIFCSAVSIAVETERFDVDVEFVAIGVRTTPVTVLCASFDVSFER